MTNPDNVGGLPELPGFVAIYEALERLRGVLCTPERFCVIVGSDADRQVVNESLDVIEVFADQMSAYGELCRAAPAGGDVECFVREMRTSKGSEFFVVVKRDGRELTPHMYTERWKAEYDVASWQHLLCGAPELDLLAYGPSEDSAPAGSGEVEEIRRELAECAVTLGNDGDEFGVVDALNRAAALLRKLQQGAE